MGLDFHLHFILSLLNRSVNSFQHARHDTRTLGNQARHVQLEKWQELFATIYSHCDI